MKTLLKATCPDWYELTLCEVSRGSYIVAYGKQVTRHRSFASALKEFSECAAHNFQCSTP